MRTWIQMLLAGALLGASACRTAPLAKLPAPGVTLDQACELRREWAGKGPPVFDAGQVITELQEDLRVSQEAHANCHRKALKMWALIQKMRRNHAIDMNAVLNGK